MRLALGILTLALIGCGGPGTPPDPSAEPSRGSETCVRFSDELVTSLAWDLAEVDAYVLTFDAGSGQSVVRRIDPRTMAVEEIARRDDGLANAGLAVGARGVSWSELPPSIWTFDGTVKRALPLADVVYGLHAVPEGYLGMLPDQLPSDVVLLSPDGTQSSRFHTDDTIRSFDASPDGRDLVVATSREPGAPLTFVVVSADDPVATVAVSGHLIGNPVLRPGRHDVVYYEDHDEGSLRRLNVHSGSSSVVLPSDVAEPRITSDGRLVHTFATPDRSEMVCFGSVS